MIKRLFKYSFLTLILLLIGAYLYFIQFGGISKILNDKLGRQLEEKYNIEFSAGEVKGSLFSGIIIKDITLSYKDSSTSYQIVYLPQIKASYSISNIWNEKYIFDLVQIDSSQFFIKQDSAGNWMLPKAKTSSTKGKETQLPLLSIDNLVFRNITVIAMRQNDVLRVENIYLDAALQVSENTYSINIRDFSFSNNKNDLKLDASSGSCTYFNGSLMFEDLILKSGDTKIKLSGGFELDNKPRGFVQFKIDNLNLLSISSVAGPKLKGELDLNGEIAFSSTSISGDIDMGGNLFFAEFKNLNSSFTYVFADKILTVDSLYGSIFESCTISGKGLIDFGQEIKKYSVTAQIANFNLNEMFSNTFESDLSGRIKINGQSFKKENLKIQIETDLKESHFYNYPLHTARGILSVNTERIKFGDNFLITYYENEFLVSGEIEYKDNINLSISGKMNNLARYKDKLFVNDPAGRCIFVGKLSGLSKDPDLTGELFSDSLWVYDIFSDSIYANIKINNFLYNKQGEIEIDFHSGNMFALPFDNGYAKLSLDSNVVYIDTAVVSHSLFRINSNGKYTSHDSGSNLVLNKLKLNFFSQQLENNEAININIDGQGFEFTEAAVSNNEAELDIKGRLNFDNSMDLKINANRIAIEPWLSIFRPDLEIGGDLSSKTTLGGTFLNPIIKMKTEFKSFSYKGLVLGDMSTTLSYSDKLLKIDSFFVFANPGEYYGRGYLPIDLAMTTSVTKRLPENNMDITVIASDERFDLVSLLLPSVEQLDGEMYTNFRLTGTPGAPHLEGDIIFNNARLKYLDLEHPLFADFIQAKLTDNKIIIESIKAYATDDNNRNGKKKYALISGELIVRSLENLYYDLEVAIDNNFPFSYELDDITGELSGKLQIRGDTPPMVTGDIAMSEMRYSVEFAEPDEGSPIMAALTGEDSWDLDLNIEIPSNYRIKNDDIDAEFSGQINLIRKNGKYRFIGQMSIVRGRGFLGDKTFKLEPDGNVVFTGKEKFNPGLDMIATTKILTTVPSDFEDRLTRERIDLSIHITGTLDTVEINPAEGSSYTKEELLTLIVANYAQSDTTLVLTQVSERISNLISKELEDLGGTQLRKLGVETFEIEPFYGDETDLLKAKFTVGFYTAQGLYVYGKSPLSGEATREVGFEYRFNRNFLMEGRRDEEELYHLNFKLHWDY